MTWRSATEEETEGFRQVLLWIKTVRETGAKYGNAYYGSDWLPSEADFEKSALLERIRSGKLPMDEPPPVGYSCPWYALVEDKGPHYIFDVTFEANWLSENECSVAQNRFTIYHTLGKKEFIVGDAKGTSYRFRLWYDEEYQHPAYRSNPPREAPKGGWFMRNMDFEPKP